MQNCHAMETRICPGSDCLALGCARFFRDEHEWTPEEIANSKERFVKTVRSEFLSLPQKEN